MHFFQASLRQRTALAALVGVALLQGCALPGAPAGPGEGKPALTKPSAATTSPAPTAAAPDAAPAAPVESPELVAQQAVTAGIDAYNRGEYQGAIRRLTAPEVAAGEKNVQLTALKYAAFSYCLTKRLTLCRQQFTKAFRLDPAFDLAPGEKGHPLWTPAFEQAKRATQPKHLRSQKKTKAPAKPAAAS